MIATDSRTGEQMITRAGPKASGWGLSGASISSAAGGSSSASSGNAGSGGFGFGPIEARVAIWSESLRFDRPSDTVYIQDVGSVNLPYDSVVSQMNSFAEGVNNNNTPYWPLGPNSNSYAFSFVESLGLDRPSPALSAPGAGKAIK